MKCDFCGVEVKFRGVNVNEDNEPTGGYLFTLCEGCGAAFEENLKKLLDKKHSQKKRK
jgi:hypothetical protein